MGVNHVVVIGTSQGGVQALQALVSALPAGLEAAVLLVLHTPPDFQSHLPSILSRAGPLSVKHAEDGEELLTGHIYVAPPDLHLLLEPGRIRLSHGPRENFTRPAIDPLFRSAAHVYDGRVIGVILTGNLDDGSRGLAQVKAAGGIAIVQNPEEADTPGMPRAALRACRVDYVLPLAGIAARLVQLTSQSGETEEGGYQVSSEPETASRMIQTDLNAQAHNQLPPSGHTSVYACPECGGVLWQDETGTLLHFQCHTGHAYSPQALLHEKSQMLEATLWAAVRLLKEKQTLTRQMSAAYFGDGDTEARRQVEAIAQMDEQNGQALRAMLEAYPNPTAQGYEVGRLLNEQQGNIRQQ